MSQANEGEKKLRKGRDAFRTISEVAATLELPQHVLRFWETKFRQIKPLKRGGNRRYYRPEDVELLSAIRQLLHNDGYTIRGVQKLLREKGVRQTVRDILAGEPAAHSSIDAPEGRASTPDDAAEVTQAIDAGEAAVAELSATSPELKMEIEVVLEDLRRLKDRLSRSV